MKPLARRKFISLAALSGAWLASLNAHDQLARSAEGPAPIDGAIEHLAAPDGNHLVEEIKKEKIRRAMLAGPVMRDAGTIVMFAGTPYAHLHICGSPWEGNEYRRGDRGVSTMRYERQ